MVPPRDGRLPELAGRELEAAIKKAVADNEMPSFQDTSGKSADTLDAREHTFSWSWIDYLMWYDPTKMPELIKLLKAPDHPSAQDALKRAYGLSMGQFLDGWTEFVKTVYSPKPRKGGTIRPPRKTG